MKGIKNRDILTREQSERVNRVDGIDDIRAESLKEIKKEIAVPLNIIFNRVIETGKFSKELKLGVVKPVDKKGSKHEISNYRPITLISNIAKI